MYADRVLLPPVSNREDLLIPFAIWDDDLAVPINLHRTTLAPANLNGFTGNAWTVKDGAILTASTTSITIPALPMGNQISALALTVGTNLGILPGDPISIADTPTGLNSMLGYVTSYSPQTGALVCQIGLTFQFEIRRRGPLGNLSGYVPFYDIGTPSDSGPLLSASLGNGILITDMGTIQIRIPEAQFRTLGNPGATQPSNSTGTYMAGLTCFDGADTRQLMIAELPVLYGGVTN